MKRVLKRLLQGTLFLTILYFIFLQPIPMYIESPGGAFGLNEMVEVDHDFFEDSGEFYLTTVGVQQATPFTSLKSVLPFRDLISKKELFGDIKDFDEYDAIQKIHMESSINTAIQVAFDEAEMDYKMNYKGIYVLQILKDSSFAEDLQVGDIIESIDGNTFQSAEEFIEYISQKNPKDDVSITYKRDGRRKETTGELTLLESGLPGIGIGLTDHTEIETRPRVEIHSGQIGGPSAGLMFSLQIYNQLLDESLQSSHRIAGTGTINSDGTVGRIGGVEKKVVAADKEEAEYFFAPNDQLSEEMKLADPAIKSNYQEAVEAADAINTDMEIIPIKEFSEAIEFLELLNTKETTYNKMLTFREIPVIFSEYQENYLVA